jgi:hypothetical protein
MSNNINNENTQQVSYCLALCRRLNDDADIQKWSRIVLFHAVEHTDPILLWGLALSSQPPREVKVRVWEMMNPEDADAHCTGEILTVKTLFCPIDTKRPRKPDVLVDQQSNDHTVSNT